MTLREYRRKRDFRKTMSRAGSKAAKSERLAFVVQKHDASHLHYDFRLEWDGVLKSWAVPKGPASTRPTSGWPCRSRTIRWSTATSRGPFLRANTAAARSCSGTRALGARG